MARKIGQLLTTKEPKVVAGPELLNKFVGASEENVRKLFADAEEDLKANGPEKAQLHIIIVDECDALFKARGSGGDSTGVHDGVVTQFLSKLDGVHELSNVMVIGMTNMRSLLDPAILRPGRLEVHIEIGLPDEHGRQQILDIHLRAMRESRLLDEESFEDHTAHKVAQAITIAKTKVIDTHVAHNAFLAWGSDKSDDDRASAITAWSSSASIATSTSTSTSTSAIPAKKKSLGIADAAAASTRWLAQQTRNFSGAELEGLVRAAASSAINTTIGLAEEKGRGGGLPSAKALDEAAKKMTVTRADFERALDDIHPALGVDDDVLEQLVQGVDLPVDQGDAIETCEALVSQVRDGGNMSTSLLLVGENGTGKTRLAAKLARQSGFPLVKFLAPEHLMGKSEAGKCAAVTRVFDDASKSALSAVVLDSLERLIELVPIGPRFQSSVLQTLLVCLQRASPPGKRRLVIATTARADLLEQLELTQAFDVQQPIYGITDKDECRKVLQSYLPQWTHTGTHIDLICGSPVVSEHGIAIKHLLQAVDMAAQKTLSRAALAKKTAHPPTELAIDVLGECLRACNKK